jgi:phosphate transport system permease protein
MSKVSSNLVARRYRAEKRFRLYGLLAVATTAAFLAWLIADIVGKAMPAFSEYSVRLPVAIDKDKFDTGDFGGLAKEALRAAFPEATSRGEKKALGKLLSNGAADDIGAAVRGNPRAAGQKIEVSLLLSAQAQDYLSGAIGELDAKAASWLETLRQRGAIERSIAWHLFTQGDSREPELAGIRGALVGSLLTVGFALLICLPLGIAAAVYLEEFAPKNRWSDLIEVNINNLAAVPSIIFGLLGLAVFLGTFGLPRSAPIVGGLVLALLVLPTIIIAARAALKSVPPSIKEAALGVGASHQQAVFHHVLPLAMPGILTGTILAVARALGETAPLLMIGMVAFIADVPKGFSDAATVLPVQIYLWSDLPEPAFKARTAAAIVILLGVLFLMNAVAIYLRKRFERRW